MTLFDPPGGHNWGSRGVSGAASQRQRQASRQVLRRAGLSCSALGPTPDGETGYLEPFRPPLTLWRASPGYRWRRKRDQSYLGRERRRERWREHGKRLCTTSWGYGHNLGRLLRSLGPRPWQSRIPTKVIGLVVARPTGRRGRVGVEGGPRALPLILLFAEVVAIGAGLPKPLPFPEARRPRAPPRVVDTASCAVRPSLLSL